MEGCVDCLSIRRHMIRPVYSQIRNRRLDRCWICYQWPIRKVVSRLSEMLGVGVKEVRACPDLVRYYQMHLVLKKYIKYEFLFNQGEIIEYDCTIAGRRDQERGCDSDKSNEPDVYQQCKS